MMRNYFRTLPGFLGFLRRLGESTTSKLHVWCLLIHVCCHSSYTPRADSSVYHPSILVEFLTIRKSTCFSFIIKYWTMLKLLNRHRRKQNTFVDRKKYRTFSQIKAYLGSLSWKRPLGGGGGKLVERLVRTVKIVLTKILGRLTLSYDELLTVLAEIQGVIYARLITFTKTRSQFRMRFPRHNWFMDGALERDQAANISKWYVPMRL